MTKSAAWKEPVARLFLPVASAMMLLFCLMGPTIARSGTGMDRGFGVSAASLLKTAPDASAFPNADTYWLRLEEIVTLHTDGTSQEVFHNTVRLFNRRGLDAADVSIPWDAKAQTVTDIRARTIRTDGTVLDLRPSDVHETSPYSEFTSYDDAKSLGFSMPGVEEGAIIDYRYTVNTHTPLQRGQFAEGWWLGDADPCRLNRYTLIAPIGMPIQFRTHNGAGVRFTKRLSADGKRRIYQWEKNNSPDLTAEPSMPPQQTWAPWLEVSTWGSWQHISEWYQDLAAPRTAATPEIAALVQRLTMGKATDTAKAQAIFYWVEKKTRYVAVELGLSAYQPHAAADICRNRYGDCKDMATLLITMLHQAGIHTAWPALLSTENKLPIHDHLATPATFDHAIVRADIDGRPVWFDATAELCPFGEIPDADRGLEAFIVRDGAGAFETIPWGGPGSDRTVYDKDVTLHEDGSADCRTVVRGQGDPALSARLELRTLRPNELTEHFQSIIGDQTDATLTQFSLSPCDDPGTTMTYKVDYSAPLWAIRTGKLLLVSDGFSPTTPTELKQRLYPLYIDSGQQVVSNVTVHLPPGYVVEALPDSVCEETQAGTLSVTYTTAPGTLAIHKVFTLVPTTISPSAYPALKASLDHFTQILKQPVVLRPANGRA